MAKYGFEQEALTCDTLADELKITRGSILGITFNGDGSVEVETVLNFTTNGQQLIKDALAKRGLPKGKKRPEVTTA